MNVITLTLNGQPAELPVEPEDTLLDALRRRAGLYGAKEGCGNGNCGACTVLLSGRPVLSCLVLAVEVAGATITTVEGLAAPGAVDPVQAALAREGGFQCGFCTPGLVLTARALLDRNPDPSDDEIRRALAGNLCRCTGYDKIVRAVRAAAAGRKSEVSHPD